MADLSSLTDEELNALAKTVGVQEKQEARLTGFSESGAKLVSGALDLLPGLQGSPRSTPSVGRFLFENEELLPAAGQVGGGILGGSSGAPIRGAVAGATIGEAARQSVQILKGQRDSFDTNQIGREALQTATIEGLTRGVSRALFGKFQAGRELVEGAGKRLGEMKESLRARFSKIPIDDILKPLKDNFNKIELPQGAGARLTRQWIRVLEKRKADGAKFLTGGDLIRIEDQMGEVAKFTKTGPAGEALQQTIKDRELNALAKATNRKASEALDKFAVDEGFKEFPALSRRVSKLIKRSGSQNFRLGFGESAALGGFTGITSGNPLTGIGTFAAARLLDNPTFRGVAFRGIERSGAGRAVTLGISETLRRLLQEQG